MNTALCSEVMMHVIVKAPRKPNWIVMGQLISRAVEKMQGEKAEEIAEHVISQYRSNNGSTDLE